MENQRLLKGKSIVYLVSQIGDNTYHVEDKKGLVPRTLTKRNGRKIVGHENDYKWNDAQIKNLIKSMNLVEVK